MTKLGKKSAQNVINHLAILVHLIYTSKLFIRKLKITNVIHVTVNLVCCKDCKFIKGQFMKATKITNVNLVENHLGD